MPTSRRDRVKLVLHLPRVMVPAAAQVAAALPVAVMGTLAILALMQLAHSLAVLTQPHEALYGEAIIYDQAGRALRGEPLYQPLDQPPYTVTAYTPLYYWLVAGLRAIAGPGFAPGRLLSFAAGLAAAGLVALLATRWTGDRRAGAFAALLFLALGVGGLDSRLPPWMALYKADVLGVALSLGTIAVVGRPQTRRRAIIAGLLAGLACLTKQTFIAAGVVGFLWLWGQDRRAAVAFAAAGVATALLPCVVMERTTGVFMANVVLANINPFRAEALTANLAALVRSQGVPLALALLALPGTWRRRDGDSDLLVYYWIATLAPLVGLGKVGSSYNYWIELAAATAVLASASLWSRPGFPASSALTLGRPRHAVPALALAAHLVVIAPAADVSHIGRGLRQPERELILAFDRVIERVQSDPGDVLAYPLDVVVLAGKPIILEPYIYSILHAESRWDAEPLRQRIIAGGISLLVLDYPLVHDGPEYHGYVHWAPFLEVLRETMVLEAEKDGWFVYVPRAALAMEAAPPP